MKINSKKLAVSAMLTAVAVSLSTFAVPIGASKCFPIQHLCNVMAGGFLGPWYGADPQPHGHRKPAGLPGQHGGRVSVRYVVQAQP